ncbi:hypothetical protein Chor_009788 [Crotalus horridus]
MAALMCPGDDQERRGEELAELYELEESFFLASQWKLKSRALAKWEHYTGCDGSPDPTVPQEINTFMSLWLEETQNDITTVVEKGSKVLELIAKLEMYVLEIPFEELPSNDVTQYQETIVQLQNVLRHKYNQATEHLLKNKQPCHAFELPKPLTTCDVAVRILHTHYDHLSPFQTFPRELPKLDLPFSEEITQSSEDKQTFSDVFSYSERRRSSSSRGSGSREDHYNKSSFFLRSTSRAHVSALRLFDISELDILEDYTVDLHQFMPILDTGLETYPYTATCEESEDNSAVTVGITIHLTDSVIYFEEPLIARWDNQDKYWRTDDIGEVVYSMKEKEVSFRMNGFFTVTLLQDAHLNMPYQAWELQPVGPDRAIFTVLTTFAEESQCMIYSVATVEDSDLLMGLREKWMTPMALLMVLKRAGMNIFPAEYSSKYVSVNKKTLLAEIMVYQQMSLVATSFAFGWSKWNLKSGENNLVFKACEHLTEEEQIQEDAWALYMFNGQRAQKLAIDEDSDAFSKNIAEGSEFHSTLYHLLKDAGSTAAMDRVRQSNYLFIDAVYQMLLATRVLTYS